MITRRIVLGCGLLGMTTGFTVAVPAVQKGQYRGRVLTEWLQNGRDMRLQEPFEFIEHGGRRWPVPGGIVVDGASIPKVFWSIIGGPFEGPYRAASVIHDHYCDRRVRTARDVHRMFHIAMITSGVGAQRAWLMYQAVDTFGPTWPDPKIDPRCEVVDEKYDFERCAQNSTLPPLTIPPTRREDLLKFADRIAGEADRADVRALREAINKL